MPKPVGEVVPSNGPTAKLRMAKRKASEHRRGGAETAWKAAAPTPHRNHTPQAALTVPVSTQESRAARVGLSSRLAGGCGRGCDEYLAWGRQSGGSAQGSGRRSNCCLRACDLQKSLGYLARGGRSALGGGCTTSSVMTGKPVKRSRPEDRGRRHTSVDRGRGHHQGPTDCAAVGARIERVHGRQVGLETRSLKSIASGVRGCRVAEIARCRVAGREFSAADTRMTAEGAKVAAHARPSL